MLALAITSDSLKIVSGSEDKTIRIWDLHQQQSEGLLQGHTASVVIILLTSDNTHIISASTDNTISTGVITTVPLS